jgi:hypothetical protein
VDTLVRGLKAALDAQKAAVVQPHPHLEVKR